MSEQRLGNSAPAPARPLVAVSHWITTRARSFGWQQAGLLALAGLMSLPVLTVAFLAVTSPMADWAHLSTYVLPRAVTQTLLLATGVALVSAVIGTAAAWLVTMHRFPGRDVLDRLLIIPLAMPTYIVAYCYVEVLDYGGPVQSAVRVLTGAQTARDYWFPDIRSLPGAVLIMSVVLYPYVYLAARASFLQQSVGALEVARTLGRTEWGAFWAVGLPMARPAIMAGTALAMMECLNDLGAVEYLGVESLAATINATWIQRSSLGPCSGASRPPAGLRASRIPSANSGRSVSRGWLAGVAGPRRWSASCPSCWASWFPPACSFRIRLLSAAPYVGMNSFPPFIIA